MKVVLIPDKFKSSLTADEVIESISVGIREVYPKAHIHSIVASDGGDGFLNAILTNIECEVVKMKTKDPLGREIEGEYLYDSKTNSAYIELAKASGLILLEESERDIMKTSTLGTGLLIKDAIQKGATSVYVGIGGSASNDAGIGTAEALGYYFLDVDGNQLEPIGGNLSKIKSIHKGRNAISLKGVSFFAINDVDNPLYGKDGAAYTYGKQKGANNEEIKILDCAMQDFSSLVNLQTKKDVAMLAGSGAAGGTAYGLKVFCDAEYISGIDFILEISKTEEIVTKEDFDYIITGEGKFDNQTLHGKLVKGVVDLGKKYKTPVLALCGQLDLDQSELDKFEQLTVLEINDPSKTLDFNMKNAQNLLQKAVESFFKK